MKVRIKVAATYSKFGLPHGKVGAQILAEGDVVELPGDYVAELIDRGMMEEYVEPVKRSRQKKAPARVTPLGIDDGPKTTAQAVEDARKVAKGDTARHTSDVSADKTFGVGKRKKRG